MNYYVSCFGHLAFFTRFEEARAFAGDFGGAVFNLFGLPRRLTMNSVAEQSGAGAPETSVRCGAEFAEQQDSHIKKLGAYRLALWLKHGRPL